uniref:Cysteine rich secreted protein n=1 Tax=Riptortus pedestris TaxID=329032 RepID=R4WP42_RIPPE|nr:cysteine rich secreted protein [Riptortus pedestris]
MIWWILLICFISSSADIINLHNRDMAPLEESDIRARADRPRSTITRCKRRMYCAGEEFECCDPWSCCPAPKVCCWKQTEFRCCQSKNSTISTEAVK